MAARPIDGSVYPELVLLAETDSESLTLHTEALAAFGFRVDGTSDGRQALQWSLSRSPDIVAAAADLEPLRGLDLFRALRRDPRTRDIPFIFIAIGTDDREEARNAGIESTVAHPCLPETLGAEVRRLLVKSREFRLRFLKAQLSASRPVDRFRSFLKAGLRSQPRTCPRCGGPLETNPSRGAFCQACGRGVNTHR